MSTDANISRTRKKQKHLFEYFEQNKQRHRGAHRHWNHRRSIMVPGWIFVLVMVCATVADSAPTDPVLLSMTWDKNQGFQVVENHLMESFEDHKYIATANFTNAINQTGWSYFEVKTNGHHNDRFQAYAAGYLEGFATAQVLYDYWVNTVQGYCDGKMAQVCEKLTSYLAENTLWVKSKIAHHCNDKECNPYWHQVDLFYEQVNGLTDGYDALAKAGVVPPIPHGDIFFMNIFGDMEDLSTALVQKHGLNVSLDRVLGDGHCSALIKMLPGNKDLLASHVTWNSYQSMLRMLKKYDLNFRLADLEVTGERVPGRVMAFSGYPGVIYSGDDFTLIFPSGLTTIETTIGNANADLWKFVHASGTVLEGVRATVANRLASTGKQWARIFAKHNSGTYNNQWMVVDYKRFKPGKSVRKGLLYILEQLPGHVQADDMSWFLDQNGHWPSYNVPYFPEIYNISGGPEQARKYGDWFTYDKTPRALIFKRDQAKVTDLHSMERMMRYNDYTRDPLSACDCSPPYSAENAISARCDLNPKNGTYPFGALGHRSHGATDMKITGYEMFKRLEFVAQSSPTYDDLPPFQWSKADFAADTPHVGMPDLWNFEPVTHKWQL